MKTVGEVKTKRELKEKTKEKMEEKTEGQMPMEKEMKTTKTAQADRKQNAAAGADTSDGADTADRADTSALLSPQRRNGIFLVLLCACIIGSIIQTALNTALSPIMAEMQIDAGTAQWLSSAYSLVMGVMVLATAFLIKRFPCRPLFLFFMTVFSAGLLLASCAQSFPVLLAGRILQATGCGLMMSLAQVVILSAYPPKERGGVMGIYGLAVCAAPVLAPTLAGVIIDRFGWQMIFRIMFAASLAVLFAGAVLLRNITPTKQISFDFLSMALCSAGFVAIVLGFGNWSGASFVSVSVLLPILLGLLALALFVRRQRVLTQPFLNLTVFGDERFRIAVLASALMYCGMMAATTLLPLYIQSMRGCSATVSGLVTMPGSLVTALVSPLAGKWYDRLGIRRLFLAGASFMLAGHLCLAGLSETTPLLLVAAFFILRQIGLGMLLMTMVTWGMSTLPSALVSDGTAVISSLRTIAGSLGAALFVSVMTAVASHEAAFHGASPEHSMILGLQIAFLGISGLSAVLLSLGLWKKNVII